MCTSVLTCSYVSGGQGVMSGIFCEMILLNLELTISSNLARLQAPRSTCLCRSSSTPCHTWLFYRDSGDRNSHPQASPANLPHQSS